MLLCRNVCRLKFVSQIKQLNGILRFRMLQTSRICNNTQEPLVATQSPDIGAGKKHFFFDTHVLVKALVDSGLTERSSEAIVNALVKTTQANYEYQGAMFLEKSQQEMSIQQLMAHIGSLRKDMVILEKSEFSALKHEYEKQNIEIKQLKKLLEDESGKLKNGMKLDMNLERSRVQEVHSESKQGLKNIENRLAMQHTDTERLIARLDNKIDKEASNLLAIYERYRNDVLKYAAGTVMTCLTVALGFYRIWM